MYAIFYMKRVAYENDRYPVWFFGSITWHGHDDYEINLPELLDGMFFLPPFPFSVILTLSVSRRLCKLSFRAFYTTQQIITYPFFFFFSFCLFL